LDVLPPAGFDCELFDVIQTLFHQGT